MSNGSPEEPNGKVSDDLMNDELLIIPPRIYKVSICLSINYFGGIYTNTPLRKKVYSPHTKKRKKKLIELL